MRQISDTHKQAMAQGRARRADAQRKAGAQRAVAFSRWSEAYAAGKATLSECPFDPQTATDNDFTYAEELGLL